MRFVPLCTTQRQSTPNATLALRLLRDDLNLLAPSTLAPSHQSTSTVTFAMANGLAIGWLEAQRPSDAKGTVLYIYGLDALRRVNKSEW